MRNTSTVDHLGGSMYGDGEFIVCFENASSQHAPLRATIIHNETGDGYSTAELDRKQPKARLAEGIIASVKATRRKIEEAS